MPTRALSKVQYGKESTRGTSVAATKILAGAEIKGVPVDRKPAFIEDALGVKVRTTRTEIHEYLVEDTLSIPNAYFQILPLIMSLGLKGGVTASETTPSQSDYLWAFTPSLTAANSPDTITLEFGDDVQEYEVEYVMFKKIKISGEVAQDGGESPVSIEVEYFGRQMTKSSFTGSLSLPTMTGMNAKLARFYKDALWANKGTTEKTNGLRKFEVEIITGLHPKMMGSASKYFNTYGESFIDATMTLTLEGNSDANAIYDDFLAGTAAVYTLVVNGPTIGSGTPHNLTVYLYGVPEMVEPLSEESNGNNLHQVLVHGIYDTVGAAMLGVNVTTNSSSI